MNGSQVGVFKQSNQVGFAGLLQSSNGRALEAEIRLEVLSNLSNETLEGQLSDEELRRLLVSSNLTKSDGTRLVSVRLLDWMRGYERRRQLRQSSLAQTPSLLTTSCGWRRFAGGLGGQLLTGSLSSRRLAGSLLGSGHGCSGETRRGRVWVRGDGARAQQGVATEADVGNGKVAVVVSVAVAVAVAMAMTMAA